MLTILFTVMATVIVLGLGMALLLDTIGEESLAYWCFNVAIYSGIILLTGAIIVALWVALVFA